MKPHPHVSAVSPIAGACTCRKILARDRIVQFVSAIATAVVIMWSPVTNAGIVTIDFPSDIVGGDPCCTFHNAVADGFRISPTCHFDEGVGIGVPGIGWDSSGCSSPGSGNAQYLGPRPPFGSAIYLDDNGHPFDLLSLDSIGVSFFAESAKDGVVTVTRGSFQPTEFVFTGGDWRGIDWVLFYYSDPGAPAAGFDRLVVSVTEPPTSMLILSGLVIALLVLRLARDAAAARC